MQLCVYLAFVPVSVGWLDYLAAAADFRGRLFFISGSLKAWQ